MTRSLCIDRIAPLLVALLFASGAHLYGQAPLRTLAGHTNWVSEAIFSRDGSLVITASRDRTAKIWNAVTGDSIRTLVGHAGILSSVAISDDGSRIVTGGFGEAIIWDAASGEKLRTLSKPGQIILDVDFDAEGLRVVTVGGDRTATIWNAETGDSTRTFSAHTQAIQSAEFSPAGTTVLTTSPAEGAILWDAVTGEEKFRLPKAMFSGSFSADGSYIVTANNDSTITVWNVATQADDRTLMLSPTQNLLDAVISPDGSLIAVPSFVDSTVIIWSRLSGEIVQRLRGHSGRIFSAQFDLSGNRIVTASEDRTAKIWPTITASAEEARTGGVPLALRSYPNPITAGGEIAFDIDRADRVRLVVTDARGRIVATLLDGSIEPGLHRVALDTASLPSGLYFYSLHTSTDRETHAMQIRR